MKHKSPPLPKSIEYKIHKFYKGVYRERNLMIVDILKRECPKRIIEYAACDTSLPELLDVAEYVPEIYHWSDRNQSFVDHANKRFQRNWFHTYCIDVEKEHLPCHSFDCLIANSSEHVNNDKDIIELMSVGSLIIMTLPKFTIKSGGHKRCFQNTSSVFQRYSDLMYINSLIDLEKVIGYKSFLVEGRRI